MYFGFFTTVICVPFCQLWNFQGPLETGIESSHSLFASLPADVLRRPDAAVQERLPVGVHLLEGDDARLALAVDGLDVLVTGAADAGLFAGLIQICHVARQSAQVTGVPSDQTAFGLNVNCVVSGLFLRSFGGPVKSRVTQLRVVVADLAALEDAVVDEARRIQRVVDPVGAQVGRLLVVNEHDRPRRRLVRAGCCCWADDEARDDRGRACQQQE